MSSLKILHHISAFFSSRKHYKPQKRDCSKDSFPPNFNTQEFQINGDLNNSLSSQQTLKFSHHLMTNKICFVSEHGKN